MKKVISLVLALAMVASLCTAVFAAGSKTVVFEVTDDCDAVVEETEAEEPKEEEVSAAVAAAIEAVAAEADEDVDADVLEAASTGKLTLATMGDFAAKEGKEYPCEITIVGEGTEDWDVIVMVQYEDAEDWEIVYAGKGGEIACEVEAAGTFAIYVVNAE